MAAENMEVDSVPVTAVSLDTHTQTEDVVTLVAQDGKTEFKVARAAARMSELLVTMMEGDKKETHLPLPNVNAATLAKVIDAMQHYAATPPVKIDKPLKSNDMSVLVPEWDAKYIDMNNELLFDVTLAANYMHIDALLELCTAKIASFIKGKTPEQIRKAFNITEEFTPEEEEAIRAENRWAY